MSNDQSPPVRKVIPYKKGGRRQSPFSKMAFQFSGTALDVAIQQREQEVEETQPEMPAPPAENPLATEASLANSPPMEANINQSDSVSPPDVLVSSVADETRLQPPPTVNKKSEIVEKQPLPRSVRPLPAKKSKSSARADVHPDLQAFFDHWKPFLTDTQIGICAYVYNNSTAVHQEYCFTSTAKLMVAVSKTERQVKTVLNQLLVWEFLLKGKTVVNAPREKRGTYYKLNPNKF